MNQAIVMCSRFWILITKMLYNIVLRNNNEFHDNVTYVRYVFIVSEYVFLFDNI
ncbi:hypothetical protein Gromo_00121 [Candidatus Gromoviella agglomerans]|nr:hypothetical protein Gromo_00121 [Candidatus Gromoviella agglomerans]